LVDRSQILPEKTGTFTPYSREINTLVSIQKQNVARLPAVFLCRTMKLALILFFIAFLLTGCGGNNTGNNSNTPDLLSGNWQLTLVRHNDVTPFAYSGFLLQSGDAISGSLILNSGNGCGGVGPVTGTVSGQNFQMDVNDFGGDLSLTGSLPTASAGGTSMSGQFSTLYNGCNFFSSSTGTWTATQVAPISGTFHGSFVSPTNGTLAVTGTLNQGPNVGSSIAQLNGTITADTSAGTRFCPYLTTGTLTGFISGTTISLNLYGPNGAQTGAIPLSPPALPGTVMANGKSLSGSYSFFTISTACPADSGTMSITFP
jgi:hypothetical protein